MGRGYDVLIRSGGAAEVGGLLGARGLNGPVSLVSDANVARLHAGSVLESLRGAGLDAKLVVIPAGEENKTLEVVSTLWNAFLEAGLDRRSTVVALGGGMTGDLAGFAAATYMRGVDWVALPTSLLAMVDASLGGKTGFDLPAGKNLVGAFHPPRLVLADPQWLSTLPQEEFTSGLAEVVKHGVIADPELFGLCAAGEDRLRQDLDQAVRRAIAVKVEIIQADPFERGVRASLNLGHTVGHALETASRYALRHGEAVSIGMVLEARLAERLKLAQAGLAEEIGVALAGLGLPVRIPPGIRGKEILRSMRLDKKKADGVVRFALPVKIGEVRTGVAVKDLELAFEDEQS
jgi:3-dehydroquinate synthase